MADTRTQRTARERAADRERIADLAVRIMDLECSMPISRAEKELLEAEQHILRDRLDMYIYPVLTLPLEVVSEIFVHFLPVYPKRAPQKGLLSPIILAQICGLWRQIAFSTPRLWRTFGITLTDESDGAGQVSAVETLLQRSGSCPLSVEFNYSRYNASPLFQTIMAHRARWQHLKLFVHVRDLSTMFGPGPFPLLHSLTTTGWLASLMDIGYRSTTSLAAPLLHRVALGRYEEVFRDMLPWAQLTTLLITSISMKHCIIILDLAPHLVFCDLTFFRAGFDDRDVPSHVALPYIRTLKLRGESSFSDLLGVLTLPALQRLHIDKSLLNNRLVWPDRISGLRSLLSQWGSIPQEIRIGFARRSLHMYAEVLPSAVFSYTRSPSRAPRITCSMKVSNEGTEAADIDEEGDWDEESHREEEEPDSDSEESSSEYSSVDSDDDSA